MQDLTIGIERACLECEKLQNKCICRKVRHEALPEKLKDKSYRAMLTHQEEKCYEGDNIRKKIDDEWKLVMKEEMCKDESDDEHNSELELEDDRYFTCRIFDVLVHCVHCVRWKLNKNALW